VNTTPDPYGILAELPRYGLVFACVFVAALLLTPLMRRIGLHYGWIGRSAPRNVHTVPTPRVGGIAIYLAFMLGLALTFVLPIPRQYPPWIELQRFGLLALGATIVEAVMIWDDIRGIRPVPKLLWQLAAVALIVLPALTWQAGSLEIVDPPANRVGIIANVVHSPFGALGPFGESLNLSALLAMGFTFFWIVGMMNAINWSDGLDGLAGGITLVSCSS